MSRIKQPQGIEWEMSIRQYVDMSYLRGLGEVFDELHEQVLDKCRQIAVKKMELHLLEQEKKDLFARQLLADRVAYNLALKSKVLRREFGIDASFVSMTKKEKLKIEL